MTRMDTLKEKWLVALYFTFVLILGVHVSLGMA